MRTHTSEFKEELKVFGRQIKGKITYYPSYDLVSESDDNILTEADLQIISEQANYEEAIEINEEDIFSISIIKNGDLLQSLMKEFDFETKVELNIGSVVNPQFGLLVNEEYEYLNYGNYIINSKEFNMDTETWSYVCYDKMLFSMVKYRGLSNVQYPITIKQFINNLCNKVGLEFEDSEFVNQSQLIYEDLYKNRDVTYRDIFDEISKIVAGNLLINDNDKLEIRYINDLIHILPVEYTQVDYIESSGTQYIDTNVYGNLGTEIVAKITNDSCKTNFLGDITVSSKAISCNFADGNVGSRFGNKNIQASLNSFINFYEPFLLKENKNGIYINNEQAVEFNTTTNFQTENTLLLFTRNNSNGPNNSRWKGKLFYCKIYDSGNLIRNFIPCYRNSDNEIGLYDTVNDVFYTNQGTDSFKYGNIIDNNINEEYLKDTNVKMAEKIGVINSVAILDTDNDLQYVSEDTQSIKENEMTRVTITDNLIAMNGETQEIADNILNKLNGLYYYANDLQTTGVCYYDFLDMFNVEARGNIYQCLLLNNEITITQGIEEHIFTEKFEEVETNSNEYTTSVISNKAVQFKINQQEGRIESKVEKNGVISAINQSAEEIQINASKLSFEGATINMTADNVKIKGENLDIDSNGVITLTDNSAASSLSSETLHSAYIIKSTDTVERAGTIETLNFINQIVANGRKIILEDNWEYQGTTGGGSAGIIEGVYSQPRLRFYAQSNDYSPEYSSGSYQDLDISLNAGISYTNINNGVTNTPLTITSDGRITCVSVTQTSKEENKKNFEKLYNAKEILNATDIYKYNMIDEKDNTKKHIGFIIGEKYNYSQDITSVENNGVDIYSMVSVLWQVVKEQQEEINQLKEMINNGKY